LDCIYNLSVVGGSYHWFRALIAGFLMRGVPSLLTHFGVDSYVVITIFGAGFIHALVTAPQGIAGQIAGIGSKIDKLIKSKKDRHL
jgi:branched-chain amino acid transport system permease protein